MTETIAVEGLVKTFGSLRALDSLDLTVEEGTVHGFLGPNGSGKSTTIRCLLGLYHPDAGTVRVLGMNPSASARDINRRVAYVPGEVALWPNLTGQQALDALAALRGSRDEARERELVERFRLDPSKPIRTYSKGNRQKVMLVAALSAPVDLLVLDEPTSGLDYLHMLEVSELLKRLGREGKTVFLITHDPELLRECCNYLLFLDKGRLSWSGAWTKENTGRVNRFFSAE